MLTRWVMAAVAVMLSCSMAHAAEFPVVGATYQLDRSQLPGQVAICITEQAMVKYLAAKATKDAATMRKMTMDVETSKDFARLKTRGGCTLISSFSQAKVIQKARGIHRAEFAAFPLEPMWAPAVYFGRRVR
jgi:hypothetical protein